MTTPPVSWEARWRDGRLGFHSGSVNPHLMAYAHRVLGPPPGRVLVPLSGKSLDVGWLADQGYQVTAVELVARAVEAFHEERGKPWTVAREGPFNVWRTEGVTTLQGDIFDLAPGTLEPFDAVYDRAALCALDAPQRPPYAALLMELLRRGGGLLLVAICYPPHEMSGPPYTVSDAEVRELFASQGRLEVLASADVLDREPRFRARGATSFIETVYSFVRRPADEGAPEGP